MNEIRKMTQKTKYICEKSPSLGKNSICWMIYTNLTICIYRFRLTLGNGIRLRAALTLTHACTRTIGHLHSKTWYISVRYISNGKCSLGLHVVTEFQLIDNVICHRPIAKFIRMTNEKKSINMRHIHNRTYEKKTEETLIRNQFCWIIFFSHFLHDENINTYISRQAQTEWEKSSSTQANQRRPFIVIRRALML